MLGVFYSPCPLTLRSTFATQEAGPHQAPTLPHSSVYPSLRKPEKQTSIVQATYFMQSPLINSDHQQHMCVLNHNPLSHLWERKSAIENLSFFSSELKVAGTIRASSHVTVLCSSFATPPSADPTSHPISPMLSFLTCIPLLPSLPASRFNCLESRFFLCVNCPYIFSAFCSSFCSSVPSSKRFF